MRFIIPILLLFLFFNCQDIERNCLDYKTGYFEFTFKTEDAEKTARFFRTEKLNIDMFNGKIDSASVRWINDCEFIQKKINPKNMAEQRAVHFKIISTTAHSYTFQYQDASPDLNKKKRVEKGTAYRVAEFKIK